MSPTISLSNGAKYMIKQLNDKGFAAYAVGGCVRDSLMGQTPKDWDICTDAKPEEILQVFSHVHTIPTGLQYGTVTVLLDEEPFEITTFRGESGYSDSRHPDRVQFLSSLQEDLSRRDFTVNAMAADSEGRITDRFHGLEDLKQGRIRCVGRPEARFSEDALRMLRALRFASRLGFSMEEKTAQAIHRQKESLLHVAPERLRKELSGLLCGKNAAAVLDSFSDVLLLLIPELEDCVGFRQYNHHHLWDVWQHTLLALQAAPPSEALRLAALLHDAGKPISFTMDKNLIGHFYGHAAISAAYAERILRRLRYDKATMQTVCTLIRLHDVPLLPPREKSLRRLLGKLGEETLGLLLQLRRADRMGKGTQAPSDIERQTEGLKALVADILQKDLCVRQSQLKLNGRDLLAMGMPAGPEMGALLQKILREVMEGQLPNEREILVIYAQKLLRNTEND